MHLILVCGDVSFAGDVIVSWGRGELRVDVQLCAAAATTVTCGEVRSQTTFHLNRTPNPGSLTGRSNVYTHRCERALGVPPPPPSLLPVRMRSRSSPPHSDRESRPQTSTTINHEETKTVVHKEPHWSKQLSRQLGWRLPPQGAHRSRPTFLCAGDAFFCSAFVCNWKL